jgi:peroxin-6
VAAGGEGRATTVAVVRADLDAALAAARARAAATSGAPSIPAVKWDDVGGLADARAAILDTVDLPLRHPSLFAAGSGRTRSGVLLYGPPGTGKTLLAKAVATECALAFVAVKGPELVSPYVGESERGVRDAFARARAAAPAVLFFDELDALAPARGRASDAGGVMDRVTASLLAELDACGAAASGGGGGGRGRHADTPAPAGPVVVIGATNRPDLLDAALLRPGRLDRLVYVGVGRAPGDRAAVLRALTRKMALAPAVDLDALAARLPPRLTGADLYGVAADAWTAALKRAAAAKAGTDSGGDPSSPPSSSPVVVTEADFLAAAAAATPSLSEDEIARYEALRAQYEGGAGAGDAVAAANGG